MVSDPLGGAHADASALVKVVVEPEAAAPAGLPVASPGA